MLTNIQAEYLLNLEKFLKEPNQVIDLSKKKNRLELVSYSDSDCEFWVEITSNQKIILKTSIHHLECNHYVGLLRIDFKGGHRNPEEITSSVPDFVKPFVGEWIEPNIPHMHVFVEGYRDLAWAVPLSSTPFPINNIKDINDLYDLIVNFANYINLKSTLTIQSAIL